MEPPNQTSALSFLALPSTSIDLSNLMDATARWSQGIGVEEKKAIKPQALNCPRCNSSNTKFCYYNNYNLSQPRYFCKTCRRYWTAGGSLRNVPVGGGSRKTKRSSSKINHTTITKPSSSLNPNQHDDLMGFFKTGNDPYARGGMMMMMNSFIPMPVAAATSNTIMIPDGFEKDGGYDHVQNNGIISTTATAPSTSTSARLFFPLEDFKPTSASTTDYGDSNSNAYWSGGGSW